MPAVFAVRRLPRRGWSRAGVIVIVGAPVAGLFTTAPVPVSAMACGLPGELLATLTLADFAPPEVGRNVTAIVQVALGASVVVAVVDRQRPTAVVFLVNIGASVPPMVMLLR